MWWAEQGCDEVEIARRCRISRSAAKDRLYKAQHRLGVNRRKIAIDIMRRAGWHEPPLPLAAKLYLAALDRLLAAVIARDPPAWARARVEMIYLVPVLFIEKQLPVPHAQGKRGAELRKRLDTSDIASALELLLA